MRPGPCSQRADRWACSRVPGDLEAVRALARENPFEERGREPSKRFRDIDGGRIRNYNPSVVYEALTWPNLAEVWRRVTALPFTKMVTISVPEAESL